jgi:adenosine deaminase CECR1
MTTFPDHKIQASYANNDDYWAARSALIADEGKLSFTAGITSTVAEHKASALVDALKKHEKLTLYGPNDEAGSLLEHAHQFLPAKGVINTAKLFEIAQKAPKGALLHCHFDAMLPPKDSLLQSARGRAGLCISLSTKTDSSEWMKTAIPKFVLKPVAYAESLKEQSCFDPSYVPGSLVAYTRFCAEFPGGLEAAEDWIERCIVLQQEDIYAHNQTVDGIWSLFLNSFSIMRGLLLYQSAFSQHLRLVLRDLAADNIQYCEMRMSFHRHCDVWTDDGSRILTRPEHCQMVSDIIAEETAAICKTGKTFYGVRIIYAVLRKTSVEDMEWAMDGCIDLKQQFPDLICGFDMCGQEDTGYSLKHWIPSLLKMRQKCDAIGLDLPFILHAGETLSHETETDANLYDALLLNCKRIGHGYSIYKHPLLMELCKTRGVAIEICPISNEQLGLCPGIRSHSMTPLLAMNVPCTINSDDPGVFSSTLSHDFYQVLTSSETMTLVGWRKLIEWSYEYSCWSKIELETRIKVFRIEWEAFCTDIIHKYGSLE